MDMFLHINIYPNIKSYTLDRLLGLVRRVFANGSGDRGSILGWVIPKTYNLLA